jgi:hypothetical protein
LVSFAGKSIILDLKGKLEGTLHTHPITRIILILMLGALLLAACGTLEVNVDPTVESTGIANSASETPALAADTPTPGAALTPTPSLAATVTPALQPDFSSQWREVRDPGTGFGFALPCWWVTYMPPEDALNNGYAITVASYDEAYFMANSLKGQWLGGQPPPGAYKMDFYVNKQIDASLSDEQAVRQALTSDQDTVDLVQTRTVGKHSALLAVQSNVNNPASTGTLYAFRLAPTSLMMVSPTQASEFTDPLVQAILNSLALSQAEPIELPTSDPGPALIAKPADCQP